MCVRGSKKRPERSRRTKKALRLTATKVSSVPVRLLARAPTKVCQGEEYVRHLMHRMVEVYGMGYVIDMCARGVQVKPRKCIIEVRSPRVLPGGHVLYAKRS